MESDYLPLATANETLLRREAGYCVCCLTEVRTVHKWIDDKEGRTAICPHCAADAVVPASLICDGGCPQQRMQILRHWHAQGFGSDES